MSGTPGENEDAILDLKLLRIPTFFSGVVGGLIFRIGIGAMPFLLPLLLQIGFGLTPFESGSLTFATAAGALAMKFTASTALRWFGFRRTLIVNALDLGRVSRRLRPVHAVDAALADLPRAARRRLLPLARVHRAQRHQLRRHRPAPDEPRHQLRQRLAADVGRGRRRRRRRSASRSSSSASATRRSTARDLSLAFVLVAIISSLSALIFARLKPDAGAARRRARCRRRRKRAPARGGVET